MGFRLGRVEHTAQLCNISIDEVMGDPLLSLSLLPSFLFSTGSSEDGGHGIIQLNLKCLIISKDYVNHTRDFDKHKRKFFHNTYVCQPLIGGGVKWVIFKTEETNYQAICL